MQQFKNLGEVFPSPFRKVDIPLDEMERDIRDVQRPMLSQDEKHEVPGCAEDLLAVYAGLDLNSEHGKDTPRRFLAMLNELTSHKNCNGDCMKWKTFPESVDQMIVVKKIPFYSVCNHHVIPFSGFAWVGYVPDGKVAGLSKFARVLNHFARKLQVQEVLTQEVVNFLEGHLKPKGLMVVTEAEHFCMTLRGAQVPGTTTRIVETLGVFADHSRTAKMEFLEAIK